MVEIAFIAHRERVRVDPGLLGNLAGQLGAETAQDVINRATEDLTVRLMQLRAANAGDNPVATARLAHSVARCADRLGLVTLGRVAGDVARCAATGDGIAFGATFARLQRISELCLVDSWYVADQPG